MGRVRGRQQKKASTEVVYRVQPRKKMSRVENCRSAACGLQSRGRAAARRGNGVLAKGIPIAQKRPSRLGATNSMLGVAKEVKVSA